MTSNKKPPSNTCMKGDIDLGKDQRLCGGASNHGASYQVLPSSVGLSPLVGEPCQHDPFVLQF
jgi:hypothetical protein